MEYFGWETPFGEFFGNNSQKTNFSSLFAYLNSNCEDASFELRITKIGRAVLKLFD
jgi:hypothetical protein